MIITSENYFSPDAEQIYMGSTQFKRFLSCESYALAILRGEWRDEVSTAMLVGSYVDSHFSGTLDIFQAQNPDIFTRSGMLKSDYQHAEYIIQRIERDEMFMRYLSGGTQEIMTGEISGVPFKIKIDSYHADRVLVDLKIVKDFKPVWIDGVGKLPFIEAWGYDFQAAIYTEIERQGRGVFADPLPFMIAGATKEKPEPDIAIISIPPERVASCLETVSELAPRFRAIKRGEILPTRCEKCDYCRATKKLEKIIDYRELSA